MSGSGLICAFALDGAGGARELDWDGVRDHDPDDGVLWVHLDYAAEDAGLWLEHDSGLDRLTRSALLAEDPRPRVLSVGDAMMMIIRGVNLNEGADPEDMVSLRIWIEERRVITMRHRRFNAIKALRQSIHDGRAPTSAGDLLADVVERILHRIARVVDKLDDDVDDLEDQVLSARDTTLRTALARFRRQAIALRRFIAPQREVLGRLQTERTPWLSDLDRSRLRESADRLLRSIEELDAAKERAMVTQEELANRMSELMNQRLYTLSLVAAIFLPLGFLTGVLGVNVAGIPGTTWDWAFVVMCSGMVLLGVVQLWLFRRLGWF
jgi:zinc transporter